MANVYEVAEYCANKLPRKYEIFLEDIQNIFFLLVELSKRLINPSKLQANCDKLNVSQNL